nr:MAG TPA: hypothetical protein [Caudoviricetes sp.]
MKASFQAMQIALAKVAYKIAKVKHHNNYNNFK